MYIYIFTLFITSEGDKKELAPAVASLSSMWTSVVTLMKAAVDFVGLEGTPEAKPEEGTVTLPAAVSDPQ